MSGMVVRRTAPEAFTASVKAPTTIQVEVTPSVLSLAEGESADVEISLASGDTTLDAWQFGSLTWTSSSATVRSPLAIRAVPFAAPALISGSGAAGSTVAELRAGYTGSYEPVLSGLEATGQTQSDEIRAQLTNSVADDPGRDYQFVQPTAGTPPDNVRRIPIVVPAGTRYLRVALFNQNSSPGADLDLYLYYCPGFRTCTAEANPSVEFASSNEVINLLPADGESFVSPGDYYVDVHGYDAPAGAATFQLFVWTVGANRGNATLGAPSSVAAGASARSGAGAAGAPHTSRSGRGARPRAIGLDRVVADQVIP